SLELRGNAYVTYPYKTEFDLRARLSVECWVYLDSADQMPVIVSCGRWQDRGWFLQKLGRTWRWHLGGVDCDGGTVPVKKWVHLIGTYDGNNERYALGRAVIHRAIRRRYWIAVPGARPNRRSENLPAGPPGR
ncbi:MAG: LamG-like jellyroll fold domain-containing protein, partial [Planctomycetota bacterium]